jgi:hypothetical protein
MGPSHFTSHPRGRCAADFYRPQKSIALAGFLNPQPLRPVASTLTTTPPRRSTKRQMYKIGETEELSLNNSDYTFNYMKKK